MTHFKAKVPKSVRDVSRASRRRIFSGNLFQLPSVILQQRHEDALRKEKKQERIQEYRYPMLKVTQRFQRILLHSVVKKGNLEEHNERDLYPVYQILSFFAHYHRLEKYEIHMLDEEERNIMQLNNMFENIFTFLTTPKLRADIDYKKTDLGDTSFRFRPGEIRLMQEVLNYDSSDLLNILQQPMGYMAFCERMNEMHSSPIWLKKTQDMLLLKSAYGQEVDCSRLILVQKETLNILNLLDPKGVIIPLSKRYALDLSYKRHRFPLKPQMKEKIY